MKKERDFISSELYAKDFEIQGNLLQAFYDSNDVLVFVLDKTVSDLKSNVLLVMNPVPNRKWDDVLANDYDLDLELVRPKKDNKYQKLDIEYSGLDVYADLIHAFEQNQNLDGDLQKLNLVRNKIIAKIAQERLEEAQDTADKARDTIQKTNQTIDDLQIKLKDLKSKLSRQKKQIGKEPTKQSAAKILRTEAQIDLLNDKTARSKKRLANAQKRLLGADEEAERLRDVLAALQIENEADESVVAPAPVQTEVVEEKADYTVMPAEIKMPEIHFSAVDFDDKKEEKAEETVEDESISFTDFEDNAINEENDSLTKGDDTMADNDEVKPLFDKDPEILDDEIAFKPVDFGGSSSVEKKEDDDDEVEVMDDTEPLTFEPPVYFNEKDDTEDIAEQKQEDVSENKVSDDKSSAFAPVASSVLDSLTGIEEETKQQRPVLDSLQPSEPEPQEEQISDVPEVHPVEEYVLPSEKEQFETIQKMEQNNMSNDNDVRPVPPVGFGTENVRPVSPMTGTSSGSEDSFKNTAKPNPVNFAGTSGSGERKKPGALYYILLVLLIVLSIFTLWLYQKNNSGNTVPSLTKVQETETVQEKAIVEPVVQQPSQVAVQLSAEEQADFTIKTPAVQYQEPKVEPVVMDEALEQEILAKKPGYKVSHSDDVFVMDENYNANNAQQQNVPSQPAVQKPVVEVQSPTVVEPNQNMQDTLVQEVQETTVVSNENLQQVYQEDMNQPMPAETTDEFVEEYTYEVAPAPQVQYNQAQYDSKVQNTVNPNVNDKKQYVTSETFVTETKTVECADGMAPDVNGCCSGEVFTDMGDGTFACCISGTTDCYEPMK